MKEEAKKFHKAVKHKVVNNSPLKGLIRFGYIIRGIFYFLIGFYGLESATKLTNNIKDFTDIIESLNSIPFNKVFLVIIFIGLLGYGLWGLVRTFVDPLKEGSTPTGLIIRLGYLISGISYLTLSNLTFQLLFNLSANQSSDPNTATKFIFNFPGGYWIIILIGIVVIIGGLSQIIYGIKENFKKTIKKPRFKKELHLLEFAGLYGYLTRGITYALLGTFFIKAGLTGNANQIKNTGQTLEWTMQQYKLPFLIEIISVGLLIFGVYSIAISGLVKLKSNEKS